MIFCIWLFVQALMALQAAPQAGRPAAAIRGQATNANTGEPLNDVYITMRLEGGNVAGSANSDANGRYEIRVPPGVYSVSADKDGFVSTPYMNAANVPSLTLHAGEEAAVDFRMIPGAVIVGAVTDGDGMPLPDTLVWAMAKVYQQGKVKTQLRATVRTNDHGEYRLNNLPAGRYYLYAGRMGIAGPQTRVFVPRFYPGAARIEGAQAIRVDAGGNKSAINFRLPDARKYSVSGRITFQTDGRPAANMAIRADPAGLQLGMSATTRSRADGTFRIEGLTPGHYRLEGRRPGPGIESERVGYFVRFLDVTAGDITNLTIHADNAATLKGILRAVGGILPERMSVAAIVRNPFGDGGYGLFPVIVAADGTFVIHALAGICDLAIRDETVSAGRSREFFVSSVTAGGQEISRSGIRVPEGTGTVEVSVTVDFRPGTIIGKTLDSKNQPIPGANLILMSADPEKRRLPAYWKQIKSDREGAFRLGSLVPGDYLIMIWTGYHPWEGLDPEAFAILEKQAVRVKVEPSAVVRSDLRLTSP